MKRKSAQPSEGGLPLETLEQVVATLNPETEPGELAAQRIRLPVGRWIDRHVGGAEKKRGLADHLAPGRQLAFVAQAARGFQQSL